MTTIKQLLAIDPPEISLINIKSGKIPISLAEAQEMLKGLLFSDDPIAKKFVKDLDKVVCFVKKIQDAGFKVALDDFGAGFCIQSIAGSNCYDTAVDNPVGLAELIKVGVYRIQNHVQGVGNGDAPCLHGNF